MSRFVMVSFMFMGWTFYEVSGGADFAPPDRPTAIDVTKMPPIADQHVTAASLVTRPVIQPEQTPVLQPRIPQAAAALPDRPKADPDLRSRVVLSQIAAVGETTFGLGIQTSTTPSNDTPVKLASLSGGLTSLSDNKIVSDTPVEPIIPLAQSVDLRHVTASRANMRGGPSTRYAVVSKLDRDTAVEVLDDDGSGWLRLRVVDGEQIGWIAASLISKKRP